MDKSRHDDSISIQTEEKLERTFRMRGHAYIRMRNAGNSIHIDYREMDSEQAQRIMDAVMAIVRDEWP